MIKVWRFLSIPIILAVCLGLMLVPTALPGGVVSASSNVTIGVQPPTTNVSFSEAFNITVVVDNPDGAPIAIAAARLNFSATYFSVTSITAGPTLPNTMLNTYDNVAGTIDFDGAMPMGANTTSSSILVCTINCLSKSVAGVGTVDFVYLGGPPPRQTKVEYGPTDYLESGNTSLMNNGTVNVAGMPVLTVDVVGNGTITINNTITPSSYPNTTNWTTGDNVTLEAIPAGGWAFHNWTGDISGPTDANLSYVIMASDKNVTAHFTELPPGISPDPASLTFNATVGGANPSNQTLDIYNSGGGLLNWTANITGTNVSWLSMSPTSGGDLTNGEWNSTQVAVNITNMTTGTYYANITISEGPLPTAPLGGFVAQAAPVNVLVTLNLGLPGVPAISVSPIPLTFTAVEGEDPPDQTLTICNSGSGILNWTLSDGGTAWLSESPTSGSLAEGECENVVVSVDVAGMELGDYSATITFTGSLEKKVPVTLHIVSALPAILVGPASLSACCLSITPQQVQPGLDVTISINVANTGGTTGSYNAVLYINGVVEDSQSVSVAAGTSKNVIFTVSKTKAGVYDVSVAGQSGQFEVVGGGWGGGLGTGGIIAIVVIVIVLIVALIFILRGTARPE